MRQLRFIPFALLVLLMVIILPDSQAQAETYPVINVDNAIGIEQIGTMGGDQGRIDLSPDNHWLAIGGLQGVWIIDLNAGDSSARLMGGHTRKVNTVRFHPMESNILASAGDDGSIHIWDVSTGETIRIIEAQASPINGLDFDTSGIFLASAGARNIRIFRYETGEQVQLFTDVPQGYRRVKFLNNSSLLLAGTLNQSLAVWNLSSGEFVGEINNGFNGDVRGLATTADGKQIAIALFSGRIITSTIATGEQLMLDYHRGGVRDVVFSPDGKLLASAGMDNRVLITNSTTGELVADYELADFTYSLDFSNDGRLLYVASNDGKLTTWDITRNQIVEERVLSFPTVRQVAYSPDGNLIVAVTDEDALGRVFNAQTHKQIAVLNAQAGRTFTIAYRPDGRLIATAGSGGDVYIWRTDTFAHADTLSTGEQRIYSLAFSPDVSVLATGSDRLIRLWDVRNKEEIMTLDNETTAWGLSFSPDGSLIAAPGGLWNAFDRAKIDVKINEFASVAISPNSDWLVTTDRFIPIDPDRIRRPGQGWVGLNNTRVAFHPDGSLVAMAVGTSIKIIDVATQTVVAIIEGHTGDIRSLAFSPDGTKLVSGGYDATIRQWAVVGDVPEQPDTSPITMDGLILDIMPTDIPTPTLSEATITANTIEQVKTTILRQAISNVIDLDVAPDGSSAVLASLGGVFFIDLTNPTAPPISMLPTDTSILSSGLAVDYSMDGGTVVVSHGYALSEEVMGGGITAWELTSGVPQLRNQYSLSGDRAFSIAISTDNVLIAIGLNSGIAQIIDLATGQLISQSQQPLFGRVNGLSFSPDNSAITLSDTAGNKAFFRTASGELVGGYNSGIAFPMWWSADYQYLYSAEESGFILRDGRSSEPVRDNPYPEVIQGDIKAVDTAKGQLVITGENIIWFLDFHSGEITQTISGFNNLITTARVTGDGQQLIGVTADNRLRVWDIESGEQITELELGFVDPQADIAMSDDGRYFALGNKNTSIRIFSAESGAFLNEIETPQSNPSRFLPASNILITTRGGNTLELWDVERGQLLDTLTTDATDIVYISHDGDYMITRQQGDLLTLQNIRTGALLFDEKIVHLSQFNDAVMSVDDNLMATVGDDAVVKLWDLEDREQTTIIRGHEDRIRRVAISPENTLLATLGNDGIRVFDYRPFSNISQQFVFNVPITSDNGFYFSVDGTLLFAHIADTLHVWSMDDGREVATFTLPDGYSKLTADGRYIIAGNSEGSIYRLAVTNELP